MLFSETAKLSGSSGFFFNGDGNAPADAINVSSRDAEIANNLPPGATFKFKNGTLVVTPAPILTAEQIRAKQAELMWVAIKAERDRRTENGGYQVGDKWYHSNKKSRSQQQDNEAAGESLEPCEWQTMDASFVTMTPQLAAQIRAARMASDRAIFAAAEAHRAAMETCDNPAEYDFSGGWPASYQDQ